MNTIQTVEQNLAFNLMLTQKLTADIPEEQMGAQPTAQLNHATWQLGHIVYSLGSAGELLGAQALVPEGYARRYGMGSTCQPPGGNDPDKQTLLNQIDAAAGAMRERLPQSTAQQLEAPFPVEALRTLCPTVAAGLVFLTGAHFSYHLGMLSAWRRTIGLGSALGM